MRVVSVLPHNPTAIRLNTHIGVVIAGPDELLNKRVSIVPMVGWDSALRGPEARYATPYFIISLL
jgi:hypothetical protein